MKEIQIPGFTTNIEAEDRAAIAIFGKEGTGKTRFLLTAPSPIGIVCNDRKTRRTIADLLKLPEFADKQVVMPTQDLIRVDNPLKLATLKGDCESKNGPVIINLKGDPPYCCSLHYSRWVADRYKKAAYDLYNHRDIRTVCIDSGTTFTDDLLFANYGRDSKIMPLDRKAVNREFKDFLQSLSGKNLIITFQSAEVWKDNKPVPGKTKLDGWSKIGYNVNALVELKRDDSKGYDEDEGWQEDAFTLDVVMCQANAAIQGPGGRKLLTNEMISFPMLATQLFPGSEMEDWT